MASEKMKELGALKKLLNDYMNLSERINYLIEIYEMAEEDPSLMSELEIEIKKLREDITDFQIRTLFTAKRGCSKCLLGDPSRCGWNGESGLGGDAFKNVHKVGGKKRF
jgi:hypothetical protein